jgi:hypothetical protein
MSHAWSGTPADLVEDGQVEPAQAFRVGEPVDLDAAAGERSTMAAIASKGTPKTSWRHNSTCSVPLLVEWGTRGEVSYVTKMRTQSVAARTVASSLVDLATAPGSSDASIPEVAGPREESLVEMAELLVARRGDGVRIEGVSDPTDPDRDLYETGALLPGPHATLGGPTFEAWLEIADRDERRRHGRHQDPSLQH